MTHVRINSGNNGRGVLTLAKGAICQKRGRPVLPGSYIRAFPGRHDTMRSTERIL
jgi:hypothetical protein